MTIFLKPEVSFLLSFLYIQRKKDKLFFIKKLALFITKFVQLSEEAPTRYIFAFEGFVFPEFLLPKLVLTIQIKANLKVKLMLKVQKW